jgi:malonyl CoA-acyl carrier protein transacylase
MDWPEFLKAAGVFLSGVITAVGLWWFRLTPVRAKAGIDTREAEAKIERDRATSDRKARKEAIDEYRELLEVQRRDAEDWRKQVHDVRGQNATLTSELAVARFHLDQLTKRVDECEADRREMRELIEEHSEAMRAAGIPVARRGPVQMHGPEGEP